MAFSSGGGSGPMADINVTPLVDVMLVLLIIFMVTAPTLSYPIDIDLPQKSLTPPPQTRESRQNALVRALASPLNAIAFPLTVALERAGTEELTVTLRLSPSAIRLSQTASDLWEGSVDVAIAQALPSGQLAKALDTTVPLRLTTAMRDQALREGLNLNRRIRPDPGAHTLRIAVRDPATGSVGSVAVPAETIRSILGK